MPNEDQQLALQLILAVKKNNIACVDTLISWVLNINFRFSSGICGWFYAG